VFVVGKGRTQREPITLPPVTRATLGDWLRVRGDGPGPLFGRLDRAGSGGRLTGLSVARLVGRLGVRGGLSARVRPHGLRHQAITAALDATGGNLAAVRAFSRHANINTVMVYDDRRQDRGASVAELVSEAY
jgi:integrase/recombinase XerC